LMSVHSLAVFLCDVIKVPEVGIAVLAFWLDNLYYNTLYEILLDYIHMYHFQYLHINFVKWWSHQTHKCYTKFAQQEMGFQWWVAMMNGNWQWEWQLWAKLIIQIHYKTYIWQIPFEIECTPIRRIVLFPCSS
jgi:hypothetical protein